MKVFAPRLALLLSLTCAVLTGCHHRQPAAVLAVPPPTVVTPEPTPEPPLVAQVPVVPTPLPPVEVKPKPPKKPKKKPVPVTAQPAAPVEVASSGAPAPEPRAVIGALTAGGDAAPEKRQHALDMLSAIDKRITALPQELERKQHEGLVRVRNFEREARAALGSGDSEGAVTLATKAKLLLDDLLK